MLYRIKTVVLNSYCSIKLPQNRSNSIKNTFKRSPFFIMLPTRNCTKNKLNVYAFFKDIEQKIQNNQNTFRWLLLNWAASKKFPLFLLHFTKLWINQAYIFFVVNKNIVRGIFDTWTAGCQHCDYKNICKQIAVTTVNYRNVT